MKPGLFWTAALLTALGCASRGHMKIVKPPPRPEPALLAPTATPVPTPVPAPVAKGKKRTKRLGAKLGSKTPTPVPTPVFRKLPNRAFAVGEKLTFAVQYAGATAGFATLSVKGIEKQSGRDCFHIQATARTHPFFDTFFKVRDTIDSFIDAESLFSWRYEKHLQEGGFKGDSFFVYDQVRHKLVDDRGNENAMVAETQDVMSCFYLFRAMDLEVGKSLTIPVTADDKKSYELKVDVLKKEKVKVLAGKFDTILVQPHLAFQGVFQQKGEVFIWVTDDARHIPVKIKSKIVIGSINIILQDAEWADPQAK